MRHIRAKAIKQWCMSKYAAFVQHHGRTADKAEFVGMYRRVKRYWNRHKTMPVLG